jgi:hypothetical protein
MNTSDTDCTQDACLGFFLGAKIVRIELEMAAPLSPLLTIPYDIEKSFAVRIKHKAIFRLGSTN